MRIFGPLPWPTISPVTVTLAKACASLVTVSPSTRSRAGRVTVSPASPASRFTVRVSPTATLCWLPPAFTTAYTTNSSIASLCPARTTASQRRVLDGCSRLPGSAGQRPPVAVQPDQRTRAVRTGRRTPSFSPLVEGPRPPYPSQARGEPPDGAESPDGPTSVSRRRSSRAAGRPAAAGPPDRRSAVPLGEVVPRCAGQRVLRGLRHRLGRDVLGVGTGRLAVPGGEGNDLQVVVQRRLVGRGL